MQLRPQQQNANTHTSRGQALLAQSIGSDGFLAPITVCNDGEAIDGSLRLKTSVEVLGDVEPIIVRSRGDRPIIHVREDIPNAKTKQAKRLSLAANRIAEVSLNWDAEVLQEWNIEGVTDDFWVEDEPTPWDGKGDSEWNEEENSEEVEDDQDIPAREEVPNLLFSSDNPFDIPVLDLAHEATDIDQPVLKWGVQGRSLPHNGLYHFYTDDIKFKSIWDNPNLVFNSGCPSVVEPNFSTWSVQPVALAVADIYKKRWLARYWQRKGVKIWVDVNVEAHLYGINMLGVPKSWRHYATRYLANRSDGFDLPSGIDAIHQDWQAICNHTGTEDSILLVYGGSPGKFQGALKQWVWLPEHNDVIRRRHNGNG